MTFFLVSSAIKVFVVFNLIMVGVALLLSGIGFSVLTIGGALRRAEAPSKESVPHEVVVSTS